MTHPSWPSWPQYGREEEEAVVSVVRSNQLFASKQVALFEQEFAQQIGTKFAIGVCNATAGLHLAIASLNIGINDEVIVTPYSWISTASSILMQNAIPVFSDIENETFGLDPNLVSEKISDRTKALIVTHMFGYPCKIDQLQEVAQKFEIPLIEDASHAHGASLKNKKLGSWGKIGVFSLHQRKNLSVGDGGIIVTNDEGIYEKIRKLRSFGDAELSYNYRMTEFAAALGLVGLKHLEKQNEFRRLNAKYVEENLKCKFLRVINPRKSSKASYHAILIEVIGDLEDSDLTRYLQELSRFSIPIRKTWTPLHVHAHFNPDANPARGLPWRHKDYAGQMKDKIYRELKLEVTNYYCPNRLLELYVHPPTNQEHLQFFIDKTHSFFDAI